MNDLKNYVNWKLTHSEKTAEAEGYPLIMENCKANKKMKQLEIYGNSFQDGTPTPDAPIEVQSVGELVTDVNDANYGKYKIPLLIKGDGETVSHNLYLNKPLNKIGNYVDYVDFNDKKVVRAIAHEKITVVAGKSSQGLLFLSTISQRPLLTREPTNPIGYAISNKFKRHEGLYAMLLTATEPLIQTYITTSGAFRAAYSFGDSSITDTAKAQDAIGDGFEMYYVLAAPIEETITCELPKLTSKTTIIEVNTSLAPSNAYGKYIKK